MYAIARSTLIFRIGASFMHAVYKLDFTAVTYHVWFERNAKIFQTVQTSADVVSDARACPGTWRRVKRCSRNQVPCSSKTIASCIFFPLHIAGLV